MTNWVQLNGEGLRITVGEFSQVWDFTVLGALVMGVLVIALFSREKFNEPTYSESDDDWSTKLKPRHLAPRRLYLRALLFYVFALEAAYLIMVAIGARALGVESAIAKTEASVPIAIALFLTGVLPNAPWIK